MKYEPLEAQTGEEVHIKIDRDLCVSVGSCAVIASQTFSLDDEGLVVLKNTSGDTKDKIIAAAQSCPTKAIHVYDKDGNILWPRE